MAAKQIDVWDVCTFDSALVELLKEHADLIRDYLETDHQIFLSHDLGRGPSDSILRPENPYASGFNDLRDVISQKMQQRTIRAFHYTRLTDGEVAAFMRDGVHLSTRATLAAPVRRDRCRRRPASRRGRPALCGKPISQ